MTKIQAQERENTIKKSEELKFEICKSKVSKECNIEDFISGVKIYFDLKFVSATSVKGMTSPL